MDCCRKEKVCLLGPFRHLRYLRYLFVSLIHSSSGNLNSVSSSFLAFFFFLRSFSPNPPCCHMSSILKRNVAPSYLPSQYRDLPTMPSSPEKLSHSIHGGLEAFTHLSFAISICSILIRAIADYQTLVCNQSHRYSLFCAGLTFAFLSPSKRIHCSWPFQPQLHLSRHLSLPSLWQQSSASDLRPH